MPGLTHFTAVLLVVALLLASLITASAALLLSQFTLLPEA